MDLAIIFSCFSQFMSLKNKNKKTLSFKNINLVFYFNKPKWDNKTGAIKGLLKNKWGEEEKRRKGRKTLKKEKTNEKRK